MIKKIVIGLVAGIVIFLSGSYLGYRNGINRSNSIVLEMSSLNDEGAAINLHNDIKILTYLKTGDVNAAEDILEKLADNEISFLDVKLRGRTKYVPWTEKRIFDAIGAAKKYRGEYPVHEPSRQFLKDEIKEAFQRISG